MTTALTRILGVTAAGLTLILAATGCATDPVADYVTAVRKTIPADESETVTDNQILTAGKFICAMRDALPASNTVPADMRPLYDLSIANCEVLKDVQLQPGEKSLLELPGGGNGEMFGGSAALDQESAANASEQLSPRGAEPARVGQRLEIWGPPMAPEPGQYVTVTAIRDVDASCPNRHAGTYRLQDVAPQNGRYLAVDLTIENTTGFDGTQSQYYAGSVGGWSFVSTSGAATDNIDQNNGSSCEGGDGYNGLSASQPGRTYQETIYVDVPHEAGWLIFAQRQSTTGNGFEYEIPAA